MPRLMGDGLLLPLLRLIADGVRRGHAPSLRELSGLLGLGQTGTHHRVHRLEALGWLEIRRNVARGLTITPEGWAALGGDAPGDPDGAAIARLASAGRGGAVPRRWSWRLDATPWDGERPAVLGLSSDPLLVSALLTAGELAKLAGEGALPRSLRAFGPVPLRDRAGLAAAAAALLRDLARP